MTNKQTKIIVNFLGFLALAVLMFWALLFTVTNETAQLTFNNAFMFIGDERLQTIAKTMTGLLTSLLTVSSFIVVIRKAFGA